MTVKELSKMTVTDEKLLLLHRLHERMARKIDEICQDQHTLELQISQLTAVVNGLESRFNALDRKE
jgi:hypothetical protein